MYDDLRSLSDEELDARLAVYDRLIRAALDGDAETVHRILGVRTAA